MLSRSILPLWDLNVGTGLGGLSSGDRSMVDDSDRHPPGRQEAVVTDFGARDAANLGEDDQPAFEAAQDTATTYFELRDRGEEDQPAFEAALRVYCSHFPTTIDNVACPLVSQIIAEACSERGKAQQRSALARRAAKARRATTRKEAS